MDYLQYLYSKLTIKNQNFKSFINASKQFSTIGYLGLRSSLLLKTAGSEFIAWLRQPLCFYELFK